MRVSLVALHFAEYASRLALALARSHEVQLHLSGPNAERELTSELRTKVAARVETQFHPQPARRAAIAHGARIARRIHAFGADVIHAQEAAPWTLAALMAFARAPRTRFVLTVHDPLPHIGADERARSRTAWANRWIRDAADIVIVHGPSLIPAMEALHPRLAGSVRPVHHGVLGDHEVSGGISGDASFLMFGRIEAYKGLGVLLDACDRLRERRHRFELRIVGTGSDLERHRARIAAAAHVVLDERFVPPLEVAAVFARAGAVVAPYIAATQSGVAALTFGARKPLVASRIGALPDVVEHETNGLLAPPGDAGELARAMARLLTGADLRARLARGAEETASGPLSWAAIAAETSQVYASARRG